MRLPWDHLFSFFSSSSPVASKLFMVYLEEKVITNVTLQLKLWVRSVDDIFIIWPHTKSGLHNILEIEQQNQLPFLDVLVTKQDLTFLHTVFRKATHL